jgi:hypothetical protein
MTASFLSRFCFSSTCFITSSRWVPTHYLAPARLHPWAEFHTRLLSLAFPGACSSTGGNPTVAARTLVALSDLSAIVLPLRIRTDTKAEVGTWDSGDAAIQTADGKRLLSQKLLCSGLFVVQLLEAAAFEHKFVSLEVVRIQAHGNQQLCKPGNEGVTRSVTEFVIQRRQAVDIAHGNTKARLALFKSAAVGQAHRSHANSNSLASIVN